MLSYAAYNPRLAGNDNVHNSFLHFYLFDWPVTPSWLYRLNQGLHVTIGVALVPIVLVKLWSVLPRLFEWPPVRSPAHLLERISLLALVGGILFELVTGLLNISNDYVFGFSFYTAHLYGAVVFIAGFVVHVSLKLRLAYRAVRRREKAGGRSRRTGRARAGRRRRSAGAASSLWRVGHRSSWPACTRVRPSADRFG